MAIQLGMFGEALAYGGNAELSQWFTPAALARRIVRWLPPITGMRVLEPSAGAGALVAPLVEAGARVTAIEIDPTCCALLNERFGGSVDVVLGDYVLTALPKRFDLVVMNPPYEDGQMALHVARALDVARRVVALVPLSFLATRERYVAIWRRASLLRLAVLVERPKFVGPGDDAPKRDYCVIDLLSQPADGLAGECLIEWWLKNE